MKYRLIFSMVAMFSITISLPCFVMPARANDFLGGLGQGVGQGLGKVIGDGIGKIFTPNQNTQRPRNTQPQSGKTGTRSAEPAEPDTPNDALLALDPNAAIEHFNKIINKSPQKAAGYLGRGDAYLKKDEFELAIKDYYTAIKVEPKNTKALLSRAEAYMSRGDYNRALDGYSAALKLNAKSLPAFIGLGNVYLEKGDYDLADKNFIEAISIDPKSAAAYTGRGEISVKKADYDRAIKNFSEAIGHDAKFVKAYLGRGLAREKKGELFSALTDYEMSKNLAPDNALARDSAEKLKQSFASGQPIVPASPAPSPFMPTTPAQPGVIAPVVVAIPPQEAGQPVAAHTPVSSISRPQAVSGQKRHALVIGNNNYDNLPVDMNLKNAVNDARKMRETLESLGFIVTLHENLPRAAMMDAIYTFTDKIGRDDAAFFFYAGHGVALGGANYILPSDIPAARGNNRSEEARLMNAAVSEEEIIKTIRKTEVRIAMLVLDACRDNPFALTGNGTRSTVGGTRGLAPAPQAEGLMTIYAAGLGETALDRLNETDAHPNSVFTRVFAEVIKTPGLELQAVARETRSQVSKLARSVGKTQSPSVYEQIDGSFYLVDPVKPVQ